jgi:stage IV sporulation protein FB
VLLIFIISIVLHECGHVLACIILHKKFGKVKVSIFGFSNNNLNLSNMKNFKKIFILVLGSLVNFIVFIFCMVIGGKLVDKIGKMNLLIGVFNLLPIVPLDGGNILICILSDKFFIKQAIESSLIISKIILVIISFLYCIGIIYLKNLFLLGIIMYVWYIFLREEKKFELYFKIEKSYFNRTFLLQ